MSTKKQEEVIFGTLNKGEAIFIIAYSLVCFILASYAQGNILAMLAFIVSLFLSFTKKALALSTIIITSPLLAQFSTGFFLILSYLPFLLFSLFNIISKQFNANAFRAYLWCIFFVSISFVLGYNPDIVVLQLQIISMTAFYVIYSLLTRNDIPIVILGYICSALIVCGLIFSNGFTSLMSFGRLGFGDNIKTLSYICAIPLSFFLFTLLSKTSLFRSKNQVYSKIIDGILFALFLFTIIMTLARGVMLSFMVGSVILLILSRKNIKTLFIFILVIAVVFYAYIFIESLDLFRTDRIMAFDEYASGNGRTEIWMHYFERIYEMGAHYVIFGIGPGEIARISNINVYAHSTILDYFFSFGIVGFSTLIIMEIYILRKLIGCNFNVPFAVVFTFIIAYSTHGSAANTSFFMLQALMIVSTKN